MRFASSLTLTILAGIASISRAEQPIPLDVVSRDLDQKALSTVLGPIASSTAYAVRVVPEKALDDALRIAPTGCAARPACLVSLADPDRKSLVLVIGAPAVDGGTAIDVRLYDASGALITRRSEWASGDEAHGTARRIVTALLEGRAADWRLVRDARAGSVEARRRIAANRPDLLSMLARTVAPGGRVSR